MTQNIQDSFPNKMIISPASELNENGPGMIDHIAIVFRFPAKSGSLEKVFAGYEQQLRKQVRAVSALTRQIPPGKTLAGYIERWDIFEAESDDILSLWRLPIIDAGSIPPRPPKDRFAMCGTIQVNNGQDCLFLFNSTRHGAEVRNTRETRVHFGSLTQIPKRATKEHPESWRAPSITALGLVLGDLPPGFWPGKTVEVIEALEPKSGNQLLMLRVPAYQDRFGRPEHWLDLLPRLH